MDNAILFMKEFEGILGAILGSVMTLIVTDILRKKGRLKIYLMEWKGKHQTFGDVGVYQGGKQDSDFYNYKFSYILQVYNRSDIPKIMRNFEVGFLNNEKEMFKFIPNDESTKRFSAPGYFIDEIEVVNINPKEIQVLKQSGYVDAKDLKYIENASKVVLSYYDEKDKRRNVLLHKGVISKSNYIFPK